MMATNETAGRQGWSYLGAPPVDMFRWPAGLRIPSGPPLPTPFAEYFEFFLNVRVPIAIAAIYATSVHYANHIRRTNNKPLAFTNTRLFKGLVLAHNIGLCIYSAWTCIGMTGAIYRTVFEIAKVGTSVGASTGQVERYLRGDSGLLGDANTGGFWRSMCDINSGIWDNGLSYYGFFFYLSKFYEVLDTVIILAKGKKSSLLQTYHHAGAMLSMWAGIRFASPPIWIFVVFNSLIHTIMYFYYTLSALKIRVPRVVKQALTTAQITQFVVGGSLACLHFFVYYFNPNTGGYCACLDDPGKVFALTLNVLYLAPLTYLFVNFWIQSYVTSLRQPALTERTAVKADKHSE